MNNNDRKNIIMSPIYKKNIHSSFFGLYGVLPLSYTEKIMYNDNYNFIDKFFDFLFVDFFYNTYNKLNSSIYNIVLSLSNKKEEKIQNNGYKLISIYKYNILGQNNLSKIILGSKNIIATTIKQWNIKLNSYILK